MADLRVTRTYLLLTDAFTCLLDKKRFEEITVSELCDAAMIRRTTFYKHFADKYEFFAFYLRQISEGFSSHSVVAGASLREYELCMVGEFVLFCEEHGALVESVLGSSMAPLLFDMLADHIAHDVTERLRLEVGFASTGVSPEVAGVFYAGGLIRLLQWWWTQGEGRFSEQQLLAQVDALLDIVSGT